MVRPIAGRRQQFLGLRGALCLGPVRIVDIGHLEPGGGGMCPVVGRCLPALQDVVDDDVTVDRIGKRLADIHILERRRAFVLVEVEHVDIRTRLRNRNRLIGVFGLQLGVTARRDLYAIKLAGQVTRERGIIVVDGQCRNVLKDRVFVVPVKRVGLHDHLFAQNMLLEQIGSVADQLARLGPFVAVLFDDLLIDRKDRRMGGHRREIGQRCGDLYFKGMIVDGANAQFVNRFFTGDDLGRIRHLHQFDIPGIFRSGRRIGQAPPGINKVVGGNRVAIRPFGIVAQMEGIGGLVVGKLIPRGHAGNQAAVLVLVHQAFEKRAQHTRAFDIGVDLRVHRLDCVKKPVGIILVFRKRVARCHDGGHGRKRHTKAEDGRKKKLVH